MTWEQALHHSGDIFLIVIASLRSIGAILYTIDPKRFSEWDIK